MKDKPLSDYYVTFDETPSIENSNIWKFSTPIEAVRMALLGVNEVIGGGGTVWVRKVGKGQKWKYYSYKVVVTVKPKLSLDV